MNSTLSPKARLPVTLRQMTDSLHDLESALQLSRGAGWTYRLEDWRIALLLGEGVLAEESGQVIGSALCWPYGDALATCGSIIVAPAMQGRGLGRALLAQLLQLTGERAILLNSTAEGMRLYQAFGFKPVGTVHQHMGRARVAAGQHETDHQVRRAGPEDLQVVTAMDQRAVGATRHRMIAALFKSGSLAVIERNGNVQGYAICRPFGSGQVIGPVVATGAEDAKTLITHFLTANEGQNLRIDIDGDSGLGSWLIAQGLPEVGQVTTMIRGERPPVSGPERIFALASQSFG